MEPNDREVMSECLRFTTQAKALTDNLRSQTRMEDGIFESGITLVHESIQGMQAIRHQSTIGNDGIRTLLLQLRDLLFQFENHIQGTFVAAFSFEADVDMEQRTPHTGEEHKPREWIHARLQDLQSLWTTSRTIQVDTLRQSLGIEVLRESEIKALQFRATVSYHSDLNIPDHSIQRLLTTVQKDCFQVVQRQANYHGRMFQRTYASQDWNAARMNLGMLADLLVGQYHGLALLAKRLQSELQRFDAGEQNILERGLLGVHFLKQIKALLESLDTVACFHVDQWFPRIPLHVWRDLPASTQESLRQMTREGISVFLPDLKSLLRVYCSRHFQALAFHVTRDAAFGAFLEISGSPAGLSQPRFDAMPHTPSMQLDTGKTGDEDMESPNPALSTAPGGISLTPKFLAKHIQIAFDTETTSLPVMPMDIGFQEDGPDFHDVAGDEFLLFTTKLAGLMEGIQALEPQGLRDTSVPPMVNAAWQAWYKDLHTTMMTSFCGASTRDYNVLQRGLQSLAEAWRVMTEWAQRQVVLPFTFQQILRFLVAAWNGILRRGFLLYRMPFRGVNLSDGETDLAIEVNVEKEDACLQSMSAHRCYALVNNCSTALHNVFQPSKSVAPGKTLYAIVRGKSPVAFTELLTMIQTWQGALAAALTKIERDVEGILKQDIHAFQFMDVLHFLDNLRHETIALDWLLLSDMSTKKRGGTTFQHELAAFSKHFYATKALKHYGLQTLERLGRDVFSWAQKQLSKGWFSLRFSATRKIEQDLPMHQPKPTTLEIQPHERMCVINTIHLSFKPRVSKVTSMQGREFLADENMSAKRQRLFGGAGKSLDQPTQDENLSLASPPQITRLHQSVVNRRPGEGPLDDSAVFVTNTSQNHVIVGGGLAGLFLAWTLVKTASPRTTIRVFERHGRWGGRILTVDNSKECAAFRVHRSHTHMHALCRELGIALHPWTYTTHVLPGNGEPSHAPRSDTPGLTQFDMAVLDSLKSEAPMSAVSSRERRTGYFESFKHDAALHGAAGATGLSDEDFFYAPAGFTALIEALVAKLEASPNVKLQKETRVQDILQHKNSMYSVSLNDGQRKTPSVVEANSVWLAVPPAAAAHFTMFRTVAGGLLHAAAVKAQPLHRLYARTGTLPWSSRDTQTRVIVPELPLGQVWSVPRMRATPPDLLQVSYTEGRLATFWHHLYQTSKQLTATVLRSLLSRITPAWTKTEVRDLESHYWDAAVHVWESSPSFLGPGHTKHLPALSTVHAVHLPQVYIVGEAVSSGQTWMEGALASVQATLTAASHLQPWTHSDLLMNLARPGTKLVLVDGRIVDVSEWMPRHPGGAAFLQAHLLTKHNMKDIGPLWERIHGHSEFARRELLYNTIAWYDNK